MRLFGMILLLSVFMIVAAFAAPCHAQENSDLDDGITPDDAVTEYDNLKKDINICYIVRRSIAHMSRLEDPDGRVDHENGEYDAGLGNVIIFPGASIHGSVYNVFSGNDATVLDTGD